MCQGKTTITEQQTAPTTSSVIPKVSPVSGINRMRGDIIVWISTLTSLYWYLVVTMKNSSLAIPTPEYCPTDNPNCTRSDLFAFQMCSAIALTYCGVLGFRCWHVTRKVHKQIPPTAEGRLFGHLREAEELAAANLAFQIWDFMTSLLIEEHCTTIYMTHHVLVAIVSWLSLEHRHCQYYAVYFFGCTEFSSIFLVCLDLARFFPPTTGSLFDLWLGLCGPFFAISFFTYRVLLWWKISYRFWSDTIYVVNKGLAEKMRPNTTHSLWIGLAINILLGLLQLHWSSIIVSEVLTVLNGDDPTYY